MFKQYLTILNNINKYDISDPKQRKELFDKFNDPETQIIWKEIHKWQRNYRIKNNITLSEFLYICEIENLSVNRQYFRPNGISQRISKKTSRKSALN